MLETSCCPSDGNFNIFQFGCNLADSAFQLDSCQMLLRAVAVTWALLDVLTRGFALPTSGSNYALYSVATGQLLHNTFRYPDALERALSHHIGRNLRDALTYHCLSYESGAAYAQQAREAPSPQKTTLLPILVDHENDTMCFLDVGEVSVGYSTRDQEFRLPVLRALKWDDFLYTFLTHNGTMETVHGDSIAISFRQEYFGADQYEDDGQARAQFLSELSARVMNTEASFKEFFWTSGNAEVFFSQHQSSSPEFEQDLQRYQALRSLLAPFIRSRQRPSGLRAGDNTKYDFNYNYNYYDDPNYAYNYDIDYGAHSTQRGSIFAKCSFATTLDELQLIPGEAKILLSSVAPKLEDSERKRCLGALAVALTTVRSVNHVALRTEPQLLNFRARSIQESGTVGSSLSNQPYTKAGLLGDGQVISIADTGVDVNSCYFIDRKGRVKPSTADSPIIDMSFRKVVSYIYNPCGDSGDTSGGHGTHVAGTVAGYLQNANIESNGQYDGMAPNAKIVFNDYSRGGSGLCIPGAQTLYGVGHAAGARVASNSWGSLFPGAQYYSGADTDHYLHRNNGMAVLFAAGNFGGNGVGTSTISMESSAKNVITVGSSQTTLGGGGNISYVAWYSSKGPTYDQRFKPDIVAPGDSLNSANAAGSDSQTCSTIVMTGTSMACPAAAGMASLVRQYFSDTSGRFWTGICRSGYRSCRAFEPTGYLLKAILVHSGVRMTLYNGGGVKDVALGFPPDYMQGFGRVGLYTALPLRGVITSFDLFVADAVNIPENSQVQYTVNVTKANQPLTITLVWYDSPNVQGTYTKALLNDIDVRAVTPSNRAFYPNGRDFADSNNNVEKIWLQNAQFGLWKVIVSSRALPVGGNQLFAIVITSSGTVGYA